MRLNPPTIFVFLISLVLVGLAVVSQLGILAIPFKFPNQNFWFAVFAWVTLAVGNLVRGL
ncbi:MAG: hypothetical protein ACR2O4_08130 [Hyphomicrobiaceae bacterium]